MNLELSKIKPKAGQLFGEVLDGQDYVSKGGIYVIGTLRRKKPSKVRIVKIGAAFTDKKGNPEEYRAKPGQVAFFKLSQGQKLMIDRKLHLVLDNGDIMGVEGGK